MNSDERRILKALSERDRMTTIEVSVEAYDEIVLYELLRERLEALESVRFVRKTFGNRSDTWMWQITPSGREALREAAAIDKTPASTDNSDVTVDADGG